MIFKAITRTVWIVVGLTLGGLASAQARWCTEGTSNFVIGREEPRAAIQNALRQCKPGDTIGITGDTSIAIGELCDFNKSIVRQPNGLIICVIKSPDH